MGLKHDHEIHGQFESIIPQDNKYQMSYHTLRSYLMRGMESLLRSIDHRNQHYLLRSIFMQNLMSIFVTQNVDING